MIDREKVINELVSYIENALSVDSDYVDCIPTDLLQYAVALLKAQEPRVMTLEEIDDDDAYWFEEKYGKKSLGRNVLIHSIEEYAREPYITLVYTYGEASYKISEYGQTWRLWTSKPTDEQREAASWGV